MGTTFKGKGGGAGGGKEVIHRSLAKIHRAPQLEFWVSINGVLVDSKVEIPEDIDLTAVPRWAYPEA